MTATKADAVVIGSGAAGGVMTYQLARKGLKKVVLLERGKCYDPSTFEHSETAMFPRTYMHGGLQTSVDRDVAIAQGCTVGGSTVINNAIWLRADLDRVLAEWAAKGAHLEMPPGTGGSTTPKDRLIAAYDELEQALSVSPLPPRLANLGTNIFKAGCEHLGIEMEYLQHNRSACIACGWCNYGCRYNRKTSTLVTYIPWAVARGARVLDECREVRIQTNGRRAQSVSFSRHGKKKRIEADRVVVCAGAIGSSALLLRSGIDVEGRVGRGFHVLGGAFVTAETNERLDGYDGIGLACIAKTGEDYVIENCFTPPIVLSIGLGGWFLSHYQRMMRYTTIAQAGVMVSTLPTGQIKLDWRDRVRIKIKFSDDDIARLKEGIKVLTRIFFAGGATKVYPASFKFLEFANVHDLYLLDKLVKRPDDLILGSAHPQGGNAIGDNAVLGGDFRVHGFDNLFVADASVFPTNIRVNSQATVMAIAHYAADFVAA